MRVAPSKNFWKFHRVLAGGLDAGTYEMVINLRFPVAGFAGTKGFVLTNANVFGGNKSSLAYLFLGLGAFHVLLTVAFGTLALFGPEPKKPTVKFTEGLVPPAAQYGRARGGEVTCAGFILPNYSDDAPAGGVGGGGGGGDSRQVQFPPEEGGLTEGLYASNFVSTTKCETTYGHTVLLA